jgi:predicted peroxiredoxin
MRKKILIIQSSGLREPKRTYAPLFFAVTAAAMGMDVTVWFTMEGVTQLKKGAAESVELMKGSGVTLRSWFDQAQEAGVTLLACQQAMDVEELTKDDLIDGVRVVGVAGVLDRCLEADHTMYF